MRTAQHRRDAAAKPCSGTSAIISHISTRTIGHDVVTDFEAGGGAQGAFDHIAFMEILPDQVTVSDTAAGALVSWDVNGDGTAEGSVLLQGVMRSALRQSDFMFEGRPGFVAGISVVGSYFVFPVAP